eukprot:817623_1
MDSEDIINTQIDNCIYMLTCYFDAMDISTPPTNPQQNDPPSIKSLMRPEQSYSQTRMFEVEMLEVECDINPTIVPSIIYPSNNPATRATESPTNTVNPSANPTVKPSANPTAPTTADPTENPVIGGTNNPLNAPSNPTNDLVTNYLVVT